jgi:hypothetical protein
LLIEALREGEAEEILQTAVAKAKAGDGPMLRCLVARLFPVPRHPGVELDVPEGREDDPRAVVESALRGLARGEITPEEAFLIARTLEKAAKVLARRVAAPGGARPAEQRAPAAGISPPAPRAAAARPPAPPSPPRPEPVGPEKSLYSRLREDSAARRDAPSAGARDDDVIRPERAGARQGAVATSGAPANRLYPAAPPQLDARRRDAA